MFVGQAILTIAEVADVPSRQKGACMQNEGYG